MNRLEPFADKTVNRRINMKSNQQQSEAKSRSVVLRTAGVQLTGDMYVPEHCAGLVLFAHGSGSSRLSPRNRYVAGVLQSHNLGTLLIDLLTPEEEAAEKYTHHLRFNIDLLADRLVGIIDALIVADETKGLKIGLFGASTGAAAAIVAASRRNKFVNAVVSRGGRPDLATSELKDLEAPTLLIVGEFDVDVLNLNKEAVSLIQAPKTLAIVPNATHLFEEPGALQEVATLAQNWFVRNLV